MKDALDTTQVEKKKAQNQLALLQQRHYALDGDLHRGFNEIQENWKEKVGAWRDKGMKT